MPLQFDNPTTITLSQAEITVININLVTGEVTLNYQITADGQEAPVRTGYETFQLADASQLASYAGTYAAVKATVYELLQSRLGQGNVL